MSGPVRNVILITCDEMRGDCTGYAGNPDVRTPCIDALARESVAFGAHFTVHGKCVPSRAALATGRYTHTDGVRTIHQLMPPERPNLMALLRTQGFETAHFGLNHNYSTLFDTHQPFEGCADWHSFIEGDLHDIVRRRWPAPPVTPGAGPAVRQVLPEFGVRRIEDEFGKFNDAARVEQVVHFLDKLRDPAKPLFLQLDLSKPHPPYEAPEPYFSLYDRSAILPWPHALPRNAPLNLREMRRIRSGGNPSPEALRELQAVYYGMISHVDGHVGRAVEALRRHGLLDTSVLVFTSDHGDFAGQYGLGEKWDTCMADCLLRVPFLLRAPGLPAGSRVDGLSCHVDVVPTVLELLGVRPHWNVHGTSLLPAVRGGEVRSAVFANGGHEREMWTRVAEPAAKREGVIPGKQMVYHTTPATMARTKMVRTDRWKLVVRLEGGNELYDLAHDSFEMDNLWPDVPARPDLQAVVLDLQSRLLDWCLETDPDLPREDKVGA